MARHRDTRTHTTRTKVVDDNRGRLPGELAEELLPLGRRERVQPLRRRRPRALHLPPSTSPGGPSNGRLMIFRSPAFARREVNLPPRCRVRRCGPAKAACQALCRCDCPRTRVSCGVRADADRTCSLLPACAPPPTPRQAVPQSISLLFVLLRRAPRVSAARAGWGRRMTTGCSHYV